MQIFGWIRVLCVTRSMELFATATLWLILELSVEDPGLVAREWHTF
jgi:hypothetical protein